LIYKYFCILHCNFDICILIFTLKFFLLSLSPKEEPIYEKAIRGIGSTGSLQVLASAPTRKRDPLRGCPAAADSRSDAEPLPFFKKSPLNYIKLPPFAHPHPDNQNGAKRHFGYRSDVKEVLRSKIWTK
ncbi:MAG: hypothetical protein AB1638_12940, partial [Nitrospirota bacterium]